MSTRGIVFGSLASLCFGASIVVNKVGLAQSALHPLEYTALRGCLKSSSCRESTQHQPRH